MRHRRDEANIRLGDSRVNINRAIERVATIAQLPDPCRAEASMPEGPAAGRVEAQRRALTTPSTAASIKSAMVRRLDLGLQP
jgi:hypothetical protein